MGLNFVRFAWLSAGLVAAALPAGAQTDVKRLTEQELLQQIESLDPQKSDPLNAAPASVAPATPRAKDSTKMRASTPPPAARPESTDKPPVVEKKSKGPTEIVALEATFDQKAHLAVFIGQVVVTDPEFNVQCDRLTAYLKDPKAAPTATPNPAPRLIPTTPPPVKGEGKKESSGGLEKAIAEADPGRIVVIHQDKKEADGSLSKSIGKGKKAIYNTKGADVFSTPNGPYSTKEGDIVLQGSPEVQQAINTCIATDEATVMVLNRNGEMKVFGPHRTTIRDQGDLTK